MAAMRLVVDENVAHNVVELLKERGHAVELVADWLGQGTPDEVIAFIADREDAIVVTHDKDFKSLVERAPSGSKKRFRRLGLISLQCSQAQARRRLEETMDLIDFEYARSRTMRDKRLIVAVSATTVTITR